jgi:galactokinase/mevalonate kinase-like predicted kinase
LGNRETLAKTLFCFDNPPGTKYVSGSQDSLGIVMPGLNKLNYNGDYWPSSIESVLDDDILTWLEDRIWLVPLYPRYEDYDVLSNTNITKEGVENLSDAANSCWDSILKKDIRQFGLSVRHSFDAQIAMFPNMVSKNILDVLDHYKNDVFGWKLSGAGGGGYLIFISEIVVKNAIRVRIHRNN